MRITSKGNSRKKEKKKEDEFWGENEVKEMNHAMAQTTM